MDPTTNLEEQLQLAAQINACDAADGLCKNCHSAAMRLAQLVEALDEWISDGGFLPETWRSEDGWDDGPSIWGK